MPLPTTHEVSPGAAERPLSLAVDVGSSSVRAMLFDRMGRPLRGLNARVSYQMSSSPDGGVQVDLHELLRFVEQAIDGLVRRAGRRLQDVAAAGVCTFSHSLVALDSHDRPCTGVLSWADTTAALAAAELRGELDQRAAWRRTGAPIHAGYWPARVRHLSRVQPAIRSWAGLGELLGERLTGTRAASISAASATGLLERRHDRWDAGLLSVLNVVPAALPQLQADNQPLGTLTAELAQRWPVIARVPWFPAWSDAACGNVGLGCQGPERAALMIGTSSALRVLLPDRDVAVAEGLFCFRLGHSGSLLGGQLSEGGGSVAWLTRMLGHRLEWLEQAAAELPPDHHRLTVLPYLTGERGPGYHDRARAVLAGLSLSSGPAELFRAVLESIALRLATLDDLLTGALGSAPAVVAAGGAIAASRLWPQIIADALGRDVLLPGVAAEPSARGAALLALDYAGISPVAAAQAVDGRVVRADGARHALYRLALTRQQELYELFSQAWAAADQRDVSR